MCTDMHVAPRPLLSGFLRRFGTDLTRDYDHDKRCLLMDQPLPHFKVPSLEIGTQVSVQTLYAQPKSEAIRSLVFL